MGLQLATLEDLPRIQQMYREIVRAMAQGEVQIWDDVYPCEFFAEDIENQRLYLLVEEEKILAAFALCDAHQGSQQVTWEDKRGKALYLDRLGVNARELRKGIGEKALGQAIGLAAQKGAEYLRLFVVDINQPAIKLYQKVGFQQAGGMHHEIIDDELTLHEYGFEIKTGIDRSCETR